MRRCSDDLSLRGHVHDALTVRHGRPTATASRCGAVLQSQRLHARRSSTGSRSVRLGGRRSTDGVRGGGVPRRRRGLDRDRGRCRGRWSAIIVAGARHGRDAPTLPGVLRGHRETMPAEAYLRPTRGDPRRCGAERAGARRGGRGRQGGRLDAGASRCPRRWPTRSPTRPGATDAQTTAAEALALGEGVCQDHAHVLIAVARTLRTCRRAMSSATCFATQRRPSRARPATPGRRSASTGWAGSVSIRRTAAVRTTAMSGSAPGCDARDAAPIRGIARGARRQRMLDVAVAVQAVQQ